MFEKLQKTLKSNTANIKDFISKKSYSYSGLMSNFNSTNLNWGVNEFISAYKTSLYFNKTIDKRAEKVGEIQFKLFKGDKEITEHEVLNILAKPNKFHSGNEFFSLYQKYKDLTGEVFILKKSDSDIFKGDKVKELYLLPPQSMKVNWSEDGEIETFEYNRGQGGTVTYLPEQIIYDFRPDPANPIKPLSLAQAGIRAIDTETQIDEYQANILRNGGKVEGIFKFKTPNLNKKQAEELKDSYKSQVSGAKKSGLPLFMGGDMEYQNTGLSPSELSYLESKKITLEDILIMTGVPKAILGSFDEIKFDNAEASIRIFLAETINPLLKAIVNSLNEDSLIPNDLELTYVDPTPANIERNLKIAENGIKYRYITINEAREITGLEPIDNGDEIPQEPIQQQPVTNNNFIVNNDKEKLVSKKNIDEEEIVLHPMAKREAREKLWDRVTKNIEEDGSEFKTIIERYFRDQRDRVIEKVDPIKSFKKGLLDEVFNQELEIKLGVETFLPFLTTLLSKYGQDAMETAGSKYNFHITGNIASFLDKKVNVFARQINETTFKKLKSEFEESFNQQETRPELVKRIRQTYGDITNSRAETIARTEVQGVSQYSRLEGYKQAGLETKIWVWSAGIKGGVRDNHQSMDGDEVPINQVFSNGLNQPADPNGPAGEVINCMCII